MKVLLINPPDHHLARIATGNDFTAGNPGRFPPLGLLALAAWLRRERPEHEVKVIDAVSTTLTATDLAREAAAWQPQGWV
jgi:hypothetical protein